MVRVDVHDYHGKNDAMSEPTSGRGPADLTPSCDRCGRPLTSGGVINPETLAVVCLDCLTDAEREQLERGETIEGI